MGLYKSRHWEYRGILLSCILGLKQLYFQQLPRGDEENTVGIKANLSPPSMWGRREIYLILELIDSSLEIDKIKGTDKVD